MIYVSQCVFRIDFQVLSFELHSRTSNAYGISANLAQQLVLGISVDFSDFTCIS